MEPQFERTGQRMTPPRTTVGLTDLSADIAARSTGARIVIAFVGAPGSGKSTTADMLQKDLEQGHGQRVQIVPMDGFHYDIAILSELGRADRKGAPDTFDVGALNMTLNRLSKSHMIEDVAVPVFDRTMELSRASARLIDRETNVILVEGNYLLLNEAPWVALRAYFDMTVMIACDTQTLRARLMQRWTDLGFSAAEATGKVEGNDLPNAQRVITDSARADIILAEG